VVSLTEQAANGLLLGRLRFGPTLFSELRDAVFARVAEHAMRRARSLGVRLVARVQW
jgi:hypothetical protein